MKLYLSIFLSFLLLRRSLCRNLHKSSPAFPLCSVVDLESFKSDLIPATSLIPFLASCCSPAQTNISWLISVVAGEHWSFAQGFEDAKRLPLTQPGETISLAQEKRLCTFLPDNLCFVSSLL